jgi:beta-galactosidase
MLEWRHFVTESYRRFQRLVIEELRPHLRPDVWITHNFMGWFESFDHYELTADLDMASWDWYIGTGHQDYLTSGATHDLTRGFKRRNYWVMETQAGHTNHMPVNNDLNRGEMRKMAWHAVAHGADAILYWQWRMAYGGQEQYWGTIVDQAGLPRPFYEEVQEIGRDFTAVGDLLAGTSPTSDVAILNSYDARWAINIHRHHKDFDYVEHLLTYYRPLAARNIAADIISADASLDGYRLVIAPALHLLNEERAEKLKAFVKEGGHLVLTVRSGVKDDHNALLPSRPPGLLADIAGVDVEEYFALVDPVPVSGTLFSGTSSIWTERLMVHDKEATKVLARFGPSNGWLDGRPAITSHPWGLGMVYTVGVWLDDDSRHTLIEHITETAGIEPVLHAPAGVEARKRIGEDAREVLILINHGQSSQVLTLPWPAVDHFTGAQDVMDVSLEPYAVSVFSRERGDGDG